MAQFSLAGLMFHIHNSLIKLSDAEFNHDNAKLTPEARDMLQKIQNVFAQAYERCSPVIDISRSLKQGALAVNCTSDDGAYQWFADFASERCMITKEDLAYGSSFMKVFFCLVDN